MAKVYIKTFGCQANYSDSEKIAGILKQDNHEVVEKIENSEIVILNSCAVKLKTQNRELGFIKEVPRDKKLLVGGCLTKVIDLRKYSSRIDALFDTNSISRVPEIIRESRDIFSEEKEHRINFPVIRKDAKVGILFVQEGCLNKCSFCATKLARGNLKSYRIGDIKREFKKAIENGCKKIYLTGQDLGCYGFDIGIDIAKLVRELATVSGDYKIRIGMMNPWHVARILDNLVQVYKNPNVMEFIHIPVQSGSNRILRHMGRVHSVETFKEILKRFREEIPSITIATDVIVGYPREEEADFLQTLELIKEVKPEVLNISKFASRPGTRASELKPLPSQEVKRRSVILTNTFKSVKGIK